ncbi:hypothetical protein R5R35_007869 [Gryllus longicercus]|uniref:Calcineurin-like phosphoesterase domain-containing protein n=1 Tax=Gryllus longicercus TaxID=2509291 RepID=A0AAN9VAW9_9ORTH
MFIFLFIYLHFTDVEENLKSPWFFIHGSDPQYGFHDYKSDYPNMDQEIQITEKLVQKINNMNPRPRFFHISGDLVNVFPSSNYHIYKLEEETFKKIFGKINADIPVLVACGNHDVGDSPTQEDLDIYKASWGDNYYSFWCGGIFFLVINSQCYIDSHNVPNCARKHEDWIEEQLRVAREKKSSRVIVLQHIPWFLKSADEPNDYFTINNPIRNAMLDKFVNSGVQKIFCRHYHQNAGGVYKDIEIVVTSAICGPLGEDKPGVRLVKVYENKIEHVYYCVDDIPSLVTL